MTMITGAGANAGVERSFELRPAGVDIEAFQIQVKAQALTPSLSWQKADVQKLDFRGIAHMRDVMLDEADYEPNYWDGVWPPNPAWDGQIGPIPSLEAVYLSGALDSTGLSGHWYTGDTDLYGFSLPDEGILEITVEFSPDCSENDVYNVWFMASDDMGSLWLLDMNFPYPFVEPVVCPFEGSYALDPYGEIEPGIYFDNEFYICVAGAYGTPPSYTITWFFDDCQDADSDGYYPEVCGGTDCDDANPLIHPCALEHPDDGVDDDCSGLDRELDTGEISEEEPNDSDVEAQDLGSLALGDCFEIEGNYCSPEDADYYLFDINADIMLTLTETFGGMTEEIACWALDMQEDFVLAVEPGDLDGDGFVDVGDYHLSACAGAALDMDEDGWYSEETCGYDCDDSDADVNPCVPEDPADCGDGIDQDCAGIEASLGEEVIGTPPDGDLDCGGSVEEEPNDDLGTGEVHDLGSLEEGIHTVYGDLSTVSYDPILGYTGDNDFYQLLMPSAGFIFLQLMFDCYSDYDLYLYAYVDPDGPSPGYELDWYTIGSDASIYVPEMVGGSFLDVDGWEFPLDLAVQIVGYNGDPGPYYLEIFYDSACLDADGDGYGLSRDPEFEEIFGVMGACQDDCDDADPEVHPGADEICDDGIDNDCDGFIDSVDPDCPVEFTLDLDASYEESVLTLDFAIGAPVPSQWGTYLILTQPSVQVLPLWQIPLPAIDPPIERSISFPFPSIGLVGLYSALFTEEGAQTVVLVWVNTG